MNSCNWATTSAALPSPLGKFTTVATHIGSDSPILSRIFLCCTMRNCAETVFQCVTMQPGQCSCRFTRAQNGLKQTQAQRHTRERTSAKTHKHVPETPYWQSVNVHLLLFCFPTLIAKQTSVVLAALTNSGNTHTARTDVESWFPLDPAGQVCVQPSSGCL